MYHYLIVDDEPMIRYSIRYMLEHSSYPIAEIYEGEDGRDAEAVLAKRPIDFVFIDINMPKKNGIELAKLIHQCYSSCIMCIISGYDEFGYAQQAMRLGVRAYLLKPVNRKELYHALEEMIREKQRKSSGWMKHEEFLAYVEKALQCIWEQDIKGVNYQANLFLADISKADSLLQITIINDYLGVLAARVAHKVGEKKPHPQQESADTKLQPEKWFIKSLEEIYVMANGITASPYYKLIDGAFRYMEQQEGWNISLEDIARKLGVNASYFSRIFKEETGMTFIAYRTKLRMERAAELLHNRDKSIAAIAIEVGYGDVTHFIRVFKKHNKQSPSEYRKRIRP